MTNISSIKQGADGKTKNVASSKPVYVQAKLMVNAPGDRYEQEADAMADQVMRMEHVDGGRMPMTGMIGRSVQRTCAHCAEEEKKRKKIMRKAIPAQGPESAQIVAGTDNGKFIQRKCAHCEAEDRKKKNPLMRKASQGGNFEAPSFVESRLTSGGGGLAMKPDTRQFMEGAFSADFSGVRIHSNDEAAAMNNEIQAKAFTWGNDIYFNRGEYNTTSNDGKKLLAHELTHVVQQTMTSDSVNTVHRKDSDDLVCTPEEDSLCFEPAPEDQVSILERPTIKFQEFTLEADEDYLIDVLREYGSLYGLANMFIFFLAFQGHASTPLELEILEEFRKAFYKVYIKASTFLDDYDAQAEATLGEMLKNSNDRVNAERIRYGLPEEQAFYDYMGNWGQESGPSLEQLGYRPPPSLAGLSKAATVLIHVKKEFKDKSTQLTDRLSSVQYSMNTIADRENNSQSDYYGGDDFERYSELSTMSDELAGELEKESRRFDLQKSELTRRYPVLASYLDDDDQLSSIANNSPNDVAGIIDGEIYEKLRNIKGVSSQLADHDVNIWKLPRLIAATNFKLKVEEWSLEDKMVKDKIEEENDESFWKSIGLGILQLGLVLLAPFTEGLTLIPAAAISGGIFVSDLEEYMKKKELVGTDFDKALVISSDDPSFFWVAVDAVFFIADASAALKAFRNIVPLIRNLKAAREIEEIERAARALEEAAAVEGGKEFAEKILAEAKTTSEKALAESLFGTEAKTLEETAQVAEREAAENILADGRFEEGTLKVTKNGQVVICSSPCRWLREALAEAIAKDPSLEAKLAEAEEKALSVTLETDPVKRAKLAKEAIEQSKELWRLLPESALAKRILAAVEQLTAKYPFLQRLSPDAVKRVVRAGLAAAEEGGLRKAVRWASRVRGQLLEEVAAERIKQLLSTSEGRNVLGLGHISEEMTFIEGSRIKDAAGAMLTDGMIVIERGETLEVIAILESKAGSFAAGHLAESLEGFSRASTNDIIEGILDLNRNDTRQILEKLKSGYPGILEDLGKGAEKSNPMGWGKVDRESLLASLENLSDSELSAIKKGMLHGQGQVTQDIERLMTEDSREAALLVDGKPVTASLPERPAFIGASPGDVPLTEIAGELEKRGYSLSSLDLGEFGMTRDELNEMGKDLFNELGDDVLKDAESALE